LRRSRATATSSPAKPRSNGVEKASPSVGKYVKFFLPFLIAIDLVALTGGAYGAERGGTCGRPPATAGTLGD
jgi:hypothetical protein